jgi:cytidylate kinase
MKKLIIAIDGPGAAGKSSAAKGLAKRLGYLYLDSGSLYRAMAWKMIQEKANLAAAWEVEALCQPLNVELRLKGEMTEIWIDEENVTPHLRLPEVTRVSATISAFPGVRKKLLAIQRLIGGAGGVVVEGRDIGTVVFPEADVKFYLDADTPIRGMRRFKEFQAKGKETDLETTTRDLEERDLKDSHRAVAPLKRGADAIVVDSTLLHLEQVIEKMFREVERKAASYGEGTSRAAD